MPNDAAQHWPKGQYRPSRQTIYGGRCRAPSLRALSLLAELAHELNLLAAVRLPALRKGLISHNLDVTDWKAEKRGQMKGNSASERHRL
jgi:hypothetical protein